MLPLIAGILFFNFTEFSFSTLFISTGIMAVAFIVSHLNIKTQFLKKLNLVIGIAFVFIIGGLMITNKKFSKIISLYSMLRLPKELSQNL